MKYIFVITYGRSGSTLLMHILNSIDGADIKGENFNTLYPIFESVERARNSKLHIEKSLGINKDDTTNPWYGASHINVKNYAKNLAKVFEKEILKPSENTRITGFKEIRYLNINKNKLFLYFDFIYKAFPNSYFIFNTRNLDDVVKSGWWKNHPESEVKTRLANFEKYMKEYNQIHPERSYAVHYDDYKENPEYFKELFSFLDEDFDLETIKSIMNRQLVHCKK
jgi:hypothetical protein